MTFSCRFEKADWVAFYRHQHRRSWGFRKPRLWLRCAVVLIAAVVVFIALRDPLGGAAQMVMISLVFLASLQAFPEAWEYCFVKRFERVVDHPDNARVVGSATMALTPERLHVQGDGAESTVAWAKVVRAERTEAHLFLYVSTIQAIVIPRASLEGASFDEVWTKVNEYLDGSRDNPNESESA